jgi:hypothetical protein
MSPHSLTAPIKVVQCDNGREFNNASSHTFFIINGVILRMSCPYISPQNSKAERIFLTIYNMLCSVHSQASIPAHDWVKGFHTTTYLLNHLPTKVISATSPYVTLHGVAPSYDHLCVFGCVCYSNLCQSCSQIGTPVHQVCFPQILH